MWPRIIALSLVAYLLRRYLRGELVLTNSGRLVAATLDGELRTFAFKARVRTGPDQLVQTGTQTYRDPGSSSIEFGGIRLSPSQEFAVVWTVETFPGGFDPRITQYDLDSRGRSFSATDNSSPNVQFNSLTSPFVPESLLEEQRRLDVYWEEDKINVDPLTPRYFATAVFGDNPYGSTVSTPGWATDGQLIVTGARPLRISSDYGNRSYEDDVPVPWWGLVGPVPGQTQWDFTSHQAGPLPASVQVQPVPPRRRAVSLGPVDPATGAAALLVDGTVQTVAGLASGVLGFDGPFSNRVVGIRN